MDMSTTLTQLITVTLGVPENSTSDSPESCVGGYSGYSRDSINTWGLVAVIIFYLLILVVGILASYCSGTWKREHDTEDIMVAGRNIGIIVGIFTMTATWVGGGYINGTAEYVFTPGYGLVWTQAPWGYALSLVLGGLLFAKRMRERNYVTMLDPFQQEYGSVVAALCYIPALMGEVFWSGAILSALGATLTVIVGITKTWSVIISAAIAVFYTLCGGLYSVAYTDVVQLTCIFIGLWIAVPFALTNDLVKSITETSRDYDNGPGWLGAVASNWSGNYIDAALLLIFGGIPWQVYFQRVLSQKTPARAQVLSFAAAFGCLIMAVPAILIGAIAFSADWSATDYATEGCLEDGIIHNADYTLTLPLVMHYLTPAPVAVVALGAVSAAVMSSADSSILSASSMFARNIYGPFRNALARCCGRDEASECELTWVLRVAVLLVAAAACAMAILVNSIYGLWFLCGDLVYVILFPQLLLVLFFPFANAYGAFTGFFVGLAFRLTGGEPILGLDPVLKYPMFDEDSQYQLFPFKTLCMAITLCTIVIVSLLFHLLFVGCGLSRKLDVFQAFEETYEVTKEDIAISQMKPTSTDPAVVHKDENGDFKDHVNYGFDDLRYKNEAV